MRERIQRKLLFVRERGETGAIRQQPCCLYGCRRCIARHWSLRLRQPRCSLQKELEGHSRASNEDV